MNMRSGPFARRLALALLIASVGLTRMAVVAQDITPLLRNRFIVDRQIGCVLHRNACDFIGNQIKGLLPEVLNNRCGRCTSSQKTNARKLMAFMRENHPEDWRMILSIYKRN